MPTYNVRRRIALDILREFADEELALEENHDEDGEEVGHLTLDDQPDDAQELHMEIQGKKLQGWIAKVGDKFQVVLFMEGKDKDRYCEEYCETEDQLSDLVKGVCDALLSHTEDNGDEEAESEESDSSGEEGEGGERAGSQAKGEQEEEKEVAPQVGAQPSNEDDKEVDEGTGTRGLNALKDDPAALKAVNMKTIMFIIGTGKKNVKDRLGSVKKFMQKQLGPAASGTNPKQQIVEVLYELPDDDVIETLIAYVDKSHKMGLSAKEILTHLRH